MLHKCSQKVPLGLHLTLNTRKVLALQLRPQVLFAFSHREEADLFRKKHSRVWADAEGKQPRSVVWLAFPELGRSPGKGNAVAHGIVS